MNVPVQSPSRTSGADIAFSEQDIGEIAAFIAAQAGGTKETVESRLRWLVLQNPARRAEDPVGFGLRSADGLIGCILCVPQTFRFGDQAIPMMGSSSFYVDDRHRGQGGRIFLKYSRLAGRLPLFGTSANASSAALWKAAGACPLPYSEGELFGVLRWPPVVEEWTQRRFGKPALSGVAGGGISALIALLRPLRVDSEDADALRPLASAEQVNELPIHGPAARLTAMRDLPYIRWRYFCGMDPSVSAFAFRSRNLDQEILVTVNQRRRGYRAQIRTLNVLDVYPEVAPKEWLRIVGSLITRYRGVVDAIVLRSQSQERQKLFCERGFERRAFDAPTSWFLDKANLLPACEWYPVPADGDGLI